MCSGYAMRWATYLSIAAFVLMIGMFFPKDAGYNGDVGLAQAYSCDCVGIEKVNKMTGAFVYNTYCYGIPHDCQNVFSCREDSECWWKEHGCKCPGTDRWAPAKIPCEKEGCECSRNECDLGLVGG